MTDFFFQVSHQALAAQTIRIQVEMLYLLPHDPIRHWIDILTNDITSETVGFEQRAASTHERIGYSEPLKIVCTIEGFLQGVLDKFGKQQTTEECSGTAGKPFVNGNNRPVVLLDLLFPQRQVGNEGHIEVTFNHRVFSSDLSPWVMLQSPS
jgi:hypothetical protein